MGAWLCVVVICLSSVRGRLRADRVTTLYTPRGVQSSAARGKAPDLRQAAAVRGPARISRVGGSPREAQAGGAEVGVDLANSGPPPASGGARDLGARPGATNPAPPHAA